MNRKFISKSNRVLRKILNSKENLDVLQDFIETFLEKKIEVIKLNSYLKKKSHNLPSEENFGIADVRVKLENREEINIGVQWIDGFYVQNKMLLYYLQIHANQLEQEQTKTIAKTITFNILDFNYLKTNHYFNKVEIPTKTERKIELYVLELSKFRSERTQIIGKKEAWMIYLCGTSEEKIEEVVRKFQKIQKLDRLLKEYWEKERME